jgi:hypothetical protein
MYGDLSHHLARATQDERDRANRHRRLRRSVEQTPEQEAAHRRTRALVRASLLLSRRADPASHRRWAEE